MIRATHFQWRRGARASGSDVLVLMGSPYRRLSASGPSAAGDCTRTGSDSYRHSRLSGFPAPRRGRHIRAPAHTRGSRMIDPPRRSPSAASRMCVVTWLFSRAPKHRLASRHPEVGPKAHIHAHEASPARSLIRSAARHPRKHPGHPDMQRPGSSVRGYRGDNDRRTGSLITRETERIVTHVSKTFCRRGFRSRLAHSAAWPHNGCGGIVVGGTHPGRRRPGDEFLGR